MRLKFTNEEKATKFLRKELVKKYGESMDLQEQINRILDLIPQTTLTDWGDSTVLKAANFYWYYECKNRIYLKDDSVKGGGLFKVLEPVFGFKDKELFSLYPISEDLCCIVPLSSSETETVVSQLDVLEAIDEDKITDLTRYKFLSKVAAESKQLRDASDTGSGRIENLNYLVGEFKARGIDGKEAVMKEIAVIEETMPDEFLEKYPDTKDGHLSAVADYYKANKESFLQVSVDPPVASLGSHYLMVTAEKIGNIKKDMKILIHDCGDNVAIMAIEPGRNTKVNKVLLLSAFVATTLTAGMALSALGGAAVVEGGAVAGATVVDIGATAAVQSTGEMIAAGLLGVGMISAGVRDIELIRYFTEKLRATQGELYMIVPSETFDELKRRNILQKAPDSIMKSLKYQFIGAEKVTGTAVV
jgi:hypothetical protein